MPNAYPTLLLYSQQAPDIRKDVFDKSPIHRWFTCPKLLQECTTWYICTWMSRFHIDVQRHCAKLIIYARLLETTVTKKRKHDDKDMYQDDTDNFNGRLERDGKGALIRNPNDTRYVHWKMGRNMKRCLTPIENTYLKEIVYNYVENFTFKGGVIYIKNTTTMTLTETHQFSTRWTLSTKDVEAPISRGTE